MKLNKYLKESKLSSIEKEMNKIHINYLNSIEKMALKVSKNTINPFLKKRKWSFISGNGTWFFDDENGNTKHPDDYPQDKEFQEIEEILMIEIEGTRWSLGEFVPSYPK